MRILHAIHDFLPRHRAGSEVYLHHLCREQGARSHEVHIFCADYLPREPHGWLRWREYDGIPVTELVNNWQFSSFGESCDSPGINRLIEHVLRAVEPDVLHVHSLLNLSVSLPKIARRHGIPIVATLHEFSLLCPSGGQLIHHPDGAVCTRIEAERCSECFSTSPYAAQMTMAPVLGFGPLRRVVSATVGGVRRIAPGAFAVASSGLARIGSQRVDPAAVASRRRKIDEVFADLDVMVAPSRALADRYLALGAPAEKMIVSGYGIPLQPHLRRPARERRLRIGFVGTLVPSKGADVLISAIRGLEKDRFEVEIHGSAGVDPAYARKLRRAAEGSAVRFVGPFDSGRTQEVYAGFDVLVVPSVWPENSPLVVHEAFAMGVPVVASQIGGLAELVEDGMSGLLFEPGSAPALTACLEDLIERPAELDRMSARIPRPKSIAADADEWDRRYRGLRTSAPANAKRGRRRKGGGARSGISAVIVNHRTPAAALLATRALSSSRLRVDEILVLDSGSSAEEARALAVKLSGVEVERIENRGFGASVNAGFSRLFDGGADRVLVLDADVIVSAECVGRLERVFAEYHACGIAGPRLVRSRAPELVAGCGITFSRWSGRTLHPGAGRRCDEGHHSVESVEALDGCALMVSRELVDTIGLIEESYFFSFEDLDYCTRARRAGFTVVCDNVAIAYHYEGASLDRRSADRIYYATRNHLAYAGRQEPLPTPFHQLRALGITGFNTAYALRGSGQRSRSLLAVADGIGDCLRGRMGKR